MCGRGCASRRATDASFGGRRRRKGGAKLEAARTDVVEPRIPDGARDKCLPSTIVEILITLRESRDVRESRRSQASQCS